MHDLALNGAGQPDEAIQVLEGAAERAPANRQVLIALTTFERDRGRLAAATRWADALLALAPSDTGAQALRRSLSSGSPPPRPDVD